MRAREIKLGMPVSLYSTWGDKLSGIVIDTFKLSQHRYAYCMIRLTSGLLYNAMVTKIMKYQRSY